MRTQRNDRLGRLDGVRKDTRGGLRVPSSPTRIGVFVYRNPDGSSRRELRHPDEVFKADSIQTLAGVPVTIGHPDHAVTIDTWKQDAVGHVGDTVGHDDKFVNAELAIVDVVAVRGVESTGPDRLVELSCGYECDLDPSPGVFNGERYDAVQRNIVYNHVALLPEGRARGGSEVRMHLDEGEVVESPHVSDMDEETKAKLAALQARCDALEAENAKLKARADASDAAAKPEVIDARVSAAVKLREDARSVLGTKDPLPSTDDEIMVAVITKRDPSFKKDALEYPLRARFDAEMALIARDGLAAVQQAATGVTNTDSTNVLAEAQRVFNERNANAFKKPEKS